MFLGKIVGAVEKYLFLDKVVQAIDNFLDNGRRTQFDEIELSLKEIAPIYMKYNTSFTASVTSVLKAGENSEKTGDENATRNENSAAFPAGDGGEKKPYELSHAALTFYTETIEPYQNYMLQYGMKRQIDEIAETIDKEGNCPSIVMLGEAGEDSETTELKSIKDVLSRVTVRDHTFRVTRTALVLALNEYGLREDQIPEVLLMSLAHDIGKLPRFRASESGRTYHAGVSAEVVEKLFSGEQRHWIRRVTEAIRLHHETTEDTLGKLLRAADRRAREEEISLDNRAFTPRRWEDWFTVKDYLTILKSSVNVVQTGHMWEAFSHDGLVYVQPDMFYECARTLAERSGVVDISLINEKEKEDAIGKIAKSLEREKAIAGSLKESNYGRFYNIEMEHGPKRKLWLITINLTAFPGFEEIEAVKETYAPLINSIKPA